jgi:hypothetical protein
MAITTNFAAMGQLTNVFGTADVYPDGSYSITIDPRFHEFADDVYIDGVIIDADVYQLDEMGNGIFGLNQMISTFTTERSFTGYLDGIQDNNIVYFNVRTCEAPILPEIEITDVETYQTAIDTVQIDWTAENVTGDFIVQISPDGNFYETVSVVSSPIDGLKAYSTSISTNYPLENLKYKINNSDFRLPINTGRYINWTNTPLVNSFVSQFAKGISHTRSQFNFQTAFSFSSVKIYKSCRN